MALTLKLTHSFILLLLVVVDELFSSVSFPHSAVRLHLGLSRSIDDVSHRHSKHSEVYFLQVWGCEDHKNGDEAKPRCNLTQSCKERWGKLLPGDTGFRSIMTSFPSYVGLII